MYTVQYTITKMQRINFVQCRVTKLLLDNGSRQGKITVSAFVGGKNDLFFFPYDTKIKPLKFNNTVMPYMKNGEKIK